MAKIAKYSGAWTREMELKRDICNEIYDIKKHREYLEWNIKELKKDINSYKNEEVIKDKQWILDILEEEDALIKEIYL